MANKIGGNLYQLKTAYSSPSVGDIVEINGAWDKYARILELRANGFHLMRGVGFTAPARVKGKDVR